MCSVLSLLSLSCSSTRLSRLISVSALVLERALYLASFSSLFRLSICMRYCWQLYLFDMYITRKSVMSRNTHICRLIGSALRMSPPSIFPKVKLRDSGSSPSLACSLMTSANDSGLASSSEAASFPGFFSRDSALRSFRLVITSTGSMSFFLIVFAHIFSAILSFALRLRGLAACSSADGTIRRPSTGRNGVSLRPKKSCSMQPSALPDFIMFFTMRSSIE